MRVSGKQRREADAPAKLPFRELIERPMGTINACGRILSEPSEISEVSGLLSDFSARVRSRAAWTLGNAAAKGLDISEAKAALEAALRDHERDVAIAGAYALTMHALNVSPGERPPLADHLRDAVRVGANLAISDSKKDF